MEGDEEVLKEEEKAIRTFNPELDRKVGPVPAPCLCLIEGANDSGKSVVAAQYCYGALRSGFSVHYVTTETSVKGLINGMRNLSWDVTEYFILGRLRINELHVKTLDWNPVLSSVILRVIITFMRRNNGVNVFIIDSLTYLLTHAEQRDILNFFTQVRNLVDENGKTIILTIHQYAVDQDLFLRLRSIADAHFVLSVKEMGEKLVRVMQVMKLKGASKGGLTVTFEVDQAFGIKVLPFSQAKA
ncbi:MAG TPA: flagellar accessory protein FlaH [Candidatus Caldiarchaeum subterraneum]|uniref:Flagellar accessory protein FlaH n=1 Tax=Caldiarchaeum subterraneum TaxID=311458 RepID=A0A833E9C9_CALS0|nr:flagellar accessory protein FlaH [Candidatus Caldarchaeum subterraneum]